MLTKYGRLHLAFSFCLALIACLAGSSSFAGAQAAERQRPVISEVSATEPTEHGVVLKANINPNGLTTDYEVVLECRWWSDSDLECYPGSSPETLLTGSIEASSGSRNVTVKVSGLEASYYYWYKVVASNTAGESQSRQLFETVLAGACPDGCGVPTGPYKTEISQASIEEVEQYGRGAPEREAARIREIAEREAAEREAAERDKAPAPTEEAEEQTSSGGSEGGGRKRLLLEGKQLRVRGGMVFVTVRCEGEGRCARSLELTAGTRSRQHGKRDPVVVIGRGRCSISAGRRSSIAIKLDSAGLAVLKRAQGNLIALLRSKSPDAVLGAVHIKR